MYVQRPNYDKDGLGYLLNQSTKKSELRKQPDPKPLKVREDLNKIDSKSIC